MVAVGSISFETNFAYTLIWFFCVLGPILLWQKALSVRQLIINAITAAMFLTISIIISGVLQYVNVELYRQTCEPGNFGNFWTQLSDIGTVCHKFWRFIGPLLLFASSRLIYFLGLTLVLALPLYICQSLTTTVQKTVPVNKLFRGVAWTVMFLIALLEYLAMHNSQGSTCTQEYYAIPILLLRDHNGTLCFATPSLVLSLSIFGWLLMSVLILVSYLFKFILKLKAKFKA